MAYALQNLVAALPPGGAAFGAALEVQLLLQATGHFTLLNSANAVLVATLEEDSLANAMAMKGVMAGVLGLALSAANLALVRAMGSETRPECYAPTWLVLTCVGLAVCLSACLVPASIEDNRQ